MSEYDYTRHRYQFDRAPKSPDLVEEVASSLVAAIGVPRPKSTPGGGQQIAIDPGAVVDVDACLDSSWPGRSPDPNTLHLDPDAMTRVVAWLEDQATVLSAVPAALREQENTSFGPARWDSARYLTDASMQITQIIADYVEALIANINQAAESIRAAATNYTATEQDIHDDVDRIR